MKALGDLVTGASAVLTPALASMAQDPATAPQMLPMLRAQPALHEAVLENLVASGADAAVILHVAGPGRPDGALRARGKAAALRSRLIARHDLREPGISGRASPARDDGAGKGLYDAGFAGLPGPAALQLGSDQRRARRRRAQSEPRPPSRLLRPRQRRASPVSC